MFIRTTPTRNTTTGETYITHRLVESRRVGGKVRQITLLNLGRHFALPKARWPELCARIEQLLGAQVSLVALSVPESVERMAQHVVAQLIVRAPQPAPAGGGDGPASVSPAAAPDFIEVDTESLQLIQPRSVGVEHVALSAMQSLAFDPLLADLGINGVMRTAIVASIVARMAAPGSELASHRWLTGTSALGELLDVDLAGMPLSRLYRASDLLMRHREAIEDRLFGSIQALFNLEETVTLYDLTNTYFEGEAAANPKARHGRSKEKRGDCAILTLGLVLDGSGFVRRSRTFAGNVSEGATLAGMLAGLNAPPGAMVIMDAGIATEANLAWLVEQGYRYLVVRRGGERQFDASRAVSVETAGGETLRIQKEIVQVGEAGQEVRLYCHSAGREAKETAIVTRFTQGFEAGLQKMADGLNKPRCEKRYDKLLERIGRLKEKSRGASQHITVNLVLDESGKTVTGIAWEKVPTTGTMATHPGVYCLRSNELTWDEDRLWRTYTMLTDLESVFRSLKGELGLRPIFHSKEERSDGHLMISVLAYQFVQVIRTRLKAQDIHASWAGLREILSVQRRVTATFTQRDGRTLHVRKSTQPEPDLKRIYAVLDVNCLPGGIKKLIV